MSKDIDELMRIFSGENKSKEISEETHVRLSAQSPNDLRIEYLHAQIDKQKEYIEGLKQDRQQRKVFSYVIFAFMCIYMAAVLAIVYFCGFSMASLSDGVIITLVTTSLANVIGIFNFVAKYLFHPKSQD